MREPRVGDRVRFEFGNETYEGILTRVRDVGWCIVEGDTYTYSVRLGDLAVVADARDEAMARLRARIAETRAKHTSNGKVDEAVRAVLDFLESGLP